MTIYEKLQKIQMELEVPKNQFNAFGKYNYRSCEDILAAVKPLTAKYNCVLFITDDLDSTDAGRHYIEAVAKLVDLEGKGEIEVSGYAREEETKKGMDAAQITGSASSYARKYALNGLFCLDDVKDPDSTNQHGKNGKDDTPATKEDALAVFDKPQEKPAEFISDAQQKRLWALAGVKDDKELASEIVKELLDGIGLKSTKEIKKGNEYNEICEQAEVLLAQRVIPVE